MPAKQAKLEPLSLPRPNSHVPLPKPPWTVHCKLHRRFDKDGRELKPYPSAATTRALAA